jgi:hypothetical protein
MGREGAGHVRGIIEEATAALEKVNTREAEEARARLMETTRDKLIDLTSQVGDQAEKAGLVPQQFILESGTVANIPNHKFWYLKK